ncbi:MAG: citrate synthase [Labilithrix sp.]|nr:citrate synthase [Labilithrix sp.]MCW5813835.1 citrate synthase [Labilithrix sp.]
MPSPIEASGLEDVVAASTRLSDVDGDAGRLVIAGLPVEDLAGNVTFEEVVHLLWHGRLPNDDELASVRAKLGAARAAARFHAVDLPDPMDALRARAAQLPSNDDRSFDEMLRVLGGVAVAAASSSATRPDPELSHAADYLRLVTGCTPSAEATAALDAYLVTVVDHGMNASTFTARVVASTESDTVSAVVAAIGALKGRLHGGAPGPVLDMLDAIGDATAAREWLTAALARGERIMGMGHRIYRVRDPRAFVLERALSRLETERRNADAKAKPLRGPDPAHAAEPDAEAKPLRGRLHLARAVEREAEALLAAKSPARALRANVEFYTAVLLEAVGLPRAMFTPTFAVSRAAGWCAHVEEQRRCGKLVRPRSRYVGELLTARSDRSP